MNLTAPLYLKPRPLQTDGHLGNTHSKGPHPLSHLHPTLSQAGHIENDNASQGQSVSLESGKTSISQGMHQQLTSWPRPVRASHCTLASVRHIQSPDQGEGDGNRDACSKSRPSIVWCVEGDTYVALARFHAPSQPKTSSLKLIPASPFETLVVRGKGARRVLVLTGVRPLPPHSVPLPLPTRTEPP